MNTGTFIATCVAAGLSFSPAADAALVEVTAFATITSALTNAPDYWTGYRSPFVLGDQITATLSYDSEASFGIVPVHNYVTGYYPANGLITTGTGWSHEAFSYFNVGASDMTFTGQSGDARYVSGFPLFYYSASLSFSDPFAAIPPYSIDGSAFLSGTLTGLYAESPFLDSSFTAKIDRMTALTTPIPGSAWLFATALAALAGLGRKRAARWAERTT
jgi:hypothetical protein